MRCSMSLILALVVMCNSELRAQEAAGIARLPLDDASIAAQWNELDQKERDVIALRNLHGLVRAMHRYCDANGTYPPAEVPNPSLPPEKRLSGFVLLLPYLGEATYLRNGEEGPVIFDRASSESAMQLYRSIDLGKAWDDPVNREAAKTLVPALLLPGVKNLRDADGFALTHLAFVRGLDGADNGAFTSQPKRIDEIEDGTSNTVAIGQIHQGFGPWIAAGRSTSRYLITHSDKNDSLSFGSEIESGCYFANLDSASYFLDLRKSMSDSVRALVTASGGEPYERTSLAAYDGIKAWEEGRLP